MTFENNKALGGNATGDFGGGGGGMFGNSFGGGGGGGLFGSNTGDNGENGGYGGNGNYRNPDPSAYDNFGGGGDRGGRYSSGGYGGFGGGGGGGRAGNPGGDGGFGGGGGFVGGKGGYGGGGSSYGTGGKNGGNGAKSGGGGAGLGGSIFMRSGSLTFNIVNLNNNTANGGSGANKGNGLGGGLFIMQSTTNPNDNNQGMPTTLPTVVSEGTLPTYSGNSANDDTGVSDNNDNVYGTVKQVTDPKAGDDVINGTSNSEALNGGAGNDTISAREGDDILLGQGGNDTLNGNEGDDLFYGGDGNDSCFGGAGIDTIKGGAGNDNLRGGAGNDILTGGAGADRFIFINFPTRAFSAASVGLDNITDFVQGTDKIVLSKTTFTGIQSAAGNGFSRPNEFRVVDDLNLITNLTTGLGAANIIYNRQNQGLYYINDGLLTGVLVQPTQIATLQGSFTPTASDFELIA
ncbi:calcium-binding protein [Nostoc sp. UHCC 0302]|uniref:calcium-binding protein n=1 Tax=Nostoc sp. UHCC 0302 TaxID=3134896 RepID=UPI00311CA2FB